MVTLIVNYFVGNKIKTEITQYKTIEEADSRILELKNKGIEISDAHYGIYEIGLSRVVEIK